jgi:hypothetical protein
MLRRPAGGGAAYFLGVRAINGPFTEMPGWYWQKQTRLNLRESA